MNKRYIDFFLILLILICFCPENNGLNGQSSENLTNLEDLKYRLVGPHRGGRVTAITGVAAKPFTFFMGTTGGGVWQTDDAGMNWKNISDGYFKVGSIGAIEVAPSDGNVIYVGTGSAAPRGNVSIGDGIYKSVDQGKSWKHIGLPKSGSIGKIIVHPENPDLVYVAVLGQIFGANKERGVYRTTNGGMDWEPVLQVSDTTGAVDLAMNPKNPREIYAAFWRAERKPWTMIDGGKDGGIWKSNDGGGQWKKLGGGLPTGLLGRIGLALSPANPDRVWAQVQAAAEEKGGLYRSDDAGKSWKRVNRDHKLRQRGWYYSHITAHPTDEHTIYANNVGFFKSIDGGKSFDQRIRVPHGDNHGVWINPDNPEIMIQCNDGGACISLNGGKSWSSQLNQPTAEFYRVTVDDQFPYRLYGAQQDNTTISVPSRFENALTPQGKWFAVGGGESGHIAVDPRNPNLIYAGTYIGQITRKYMDRGHSRDIVAYPQMHDGTAPRDIKYRFQWNAPIRISPHDPDIVYHCSQYVHRTRDGGNTWEVISPDLTTNKDAYQDIPGGPIQHDHTGVELYTTIFAFEESPHTPGVLWAGSDDGLVHLSKDDGRNWENITPKEMPLEGTVNSIEISAHQPGRALMSVYKYRENDFSPYVFRTDDFGKSWKLLTNGKNGIPANHFVRVAKEDPIKKGLLFAGTEFGMYYSMNDGENWYPFQQNLPITPITDLTIKNNDLVVATQGRSFWILDDLSPLREYSEGLLAKDLHLFKPADAHRTQFRNFRGGAAPTAAPNGALIYFYLKDKPGKRETVKLSILDQAGQVRRVFSSNPKKNKKEDQLSLKKGINRLVWDLSYESPEVQPKAVFSLARMSGVTAPTGEHKIVLEMGDQKLEQSLLLKKDPRWSQTDADLRAQYDLTMLVKDLLNRCHATIGQLRSVRDQLKETADRSKKAGLDAAIGKKSKLIIAKINELESTLIQKRNESGQDPINFPSMIDDQIAYLYSTVNSLDDRPNQGAHDRYEDLRVQMEKHFSEVEVLWEEDVKKFNDFLQEQGVLNILVEGR